MRGTSPSEYRFGQIELRPDRRQLLIRGKSAPLGGRAFDVLMALIERRDRVVTKSELLDSVWAGRAVEENNLVVQVSTLRRLLGSEVIATIPGRGYRFVSPETAAHVAAPPALAPATPSTAEAALPALVGREVDFDRLRQSTCASRLVTVTGAGGIGKTLIARHLMKRLRDLYRDGAVLVDLTAVSAPERVVPVIAQALALQLRGPDPLQALATAVAPLDVLLVVDNAEHLVDEVARVARALLQNAAGTRMLVTSQTLLKIPEEQVMRLEPLSLPPLGSSTEEALRHGAVALFVARIKAQQSGFCIDDGNVDQVADICRQLDGLPLAIEMAAARVPLLGLAGLQRALESRLQLLTRGWRNAPTRQQALSAALEWSHSLLGPREQAVFRRLAVFPGGCSLELAQMTVADETIDEWGVVDAMGELLEHSLLHLSNDEPLRYRLLESTRLFALERLREAGEEIGTRDRHAAAMCLHWARLDEDRWTGRRGIDEVTKLLEADFEGGLAAYRFALERGDKTKAVTLMPILHVVRQATSFAEMIALWEQTEPLIDDDEIDPLLRARWTIGAATAFVMLSTRSVHFARSAVELYRRAGHTRGEYLGLCKLAFASASRNLEEAMLAVREFRALEEGASWAPSVLSSGANAAALTAFMQGDQETALKELRRQHSLALQAGDSLIADAVSTNLIIVEVSLGFVDDAIRRGVEVVDRLRQKRNWFILSTAACGLMSAYLAAGQPEQARNVAESFPSTLLQAADEPFWAENMALLAALEQRPDDAARLLAHSNVLMAARGATRDTAAANTAQRVEMLLKAALSEDSYSRLMDINTPFPRDQLYQLALRRTV